MSREHPIDKHQQDQGSYPDRYQTREQKLDWFNPTAEDLKLYASEDGSDIFDPTKPIDKDLSILKLIQPYQYEKVKTKNPAEAESKSTPYQEQESGTDEAEEDDLDDDEDEDDDSEDSGDETPRSRTRTTRERKYRKICRVRHNQLLFRIAYLEAENVKLMEQLTILQNNSAGDSGESDLVTID